jgi:arabinosaccharide transport system substrate-binding protein
MSLFPYGKAALVMFLLALFSGGWVVTHQPPPTKADIVYWTFAKDHYDAYERVIPAFEKAHHCKVDLQILNNQAYVARLQASFLAGIDVPDGADLEIGTAGTMFRGPAKDVPFIDLKPRLIQSGLYDRYVQARFAPYTKQGCIYGLPQDVHPVQLAYRRDLFEKLGIDPDKIKTWDDFIAIGKKITIPQKQYMIELSDTSVGTGGLETILIQRGGGYFDPAGSCIFDNQIGVDAMKFYVPLIAGPDKIGATTGDFFGQSWVQSVEEGYFLCMICPDWRTHIIQQNIAAVKGKMAVMPLPAVYAGGIRTSTWGGTMMGITKDCKKPDLMWQFVQYLATDPSRFVANFDNTNILPPVKDAWKLPGFNEPNPFFSNQPLGALYANLAPQVPPQYTSAVIDTAKNKLGEALIDCAAYYNDHGADAGWDSFVRAKLKEKADDVRALQARNPY